MKKGILLILTQILTVCVLFAQNTINLDLKQAIDIANEGSLESFRIKNIYLSGYWEYRTYKANRLPSLSMNLTPGQYYRDVIKRYDYDQNIEVFRSQQSFNASGDLTIEQNFDLTGGTFFIDTELGFMRNFGDNTYSQFSSVPIRLGYNQSLIGYNAFRWERKIEPIKYEKVKREYIYNFEEISEKVAGYFFEVAMAQEECNLTKENMLSSDTLYKIGLQKHKIASISRADLLTLKLDAVNAKNSLQNASITLKRAVFSLVSFLNLDKESQIVIELPSHPQQLDISIDKAILMARMNNPIILKQRQNVLEAEQNVDKTKRESRFNASIGASIGLNQYDENIGKAYRNPMQQEVVTLSVKIPLVDWGVRKGKHNMAVNDLNVIRISSEQEIVNLEEEIIMTVNDFNTQQVMITSAEEALELSVIVYNETKQRFIIGKADMNSLTLANNRHQEAQRNYISTLKNYWVNFYKIRKLTLYDFVTDCSLVEKIEFDNIVYN